LPTMLKSLRLLKPDLAKVDQPVFRHKAMVDPKHWVLKPLGQPLQIHEGEGSFRCQPGDEGDEGRHDPQDDERNQYQGEHYSLASPHPLQVLSHNGHHRAPIHLSLSPCRAK